MFKTDDALQKKLDNTLKELDNANKLVEKLESELKNTHSVDLNDSNSDLNYAEDLSIKKLTKNAPAVKEMFDEIKNKDIIS